MALQADDFPSEDRYVLEVQVTWPGTRPQTFPSGGNVSFYVYPQLA